MQCLRPLSQWGGPLIQIFTRFPVTSMQDGVQFILDITGFIDSVCPPIMQPKGGRIVAEWRVINACLLRPTSPLYANQTMCFPQFTEEMTSIVASNQFAMPWTTQSVGWPPPTDLFPKDSSLPTRCPAIYRGNI